ncbi:MAG: glycosyltransferase, partial [Spirochaetota bacterium]|nr:glycosyltransferase [Spirochaetota bacterium]
GENFSRVPAIFQEARRRLSDEIISWGFLKQRVEYVRALETAEIVVSTSNQENFGLSMVEAMSCGCLPVAPRRLSYPEIIPPELHPLCLYDRDDDLPRVLSRALYSVRSPAGQAHAVHAHARRLRQTMRKFSWDTLIEAYDRLSEETAAEAGSETAADTGGVR